ncbi:MAG TPA: UDP-N-acetylmuramoyl-L-alanyl-D-glutamate--2,6-diaminopimelate ligase [bacterium]
MTVETIVMRLDRLLTALPKAVTTGDLDREVTTIAAHHDAVRPGAVFVAVRGFRHDGHTFAAEAAARGAAAVVLEREIPLPQAVTRVLVGDSRVALAHLSAAFFGFPSQSLDVIGVTGTNGKGTTAYLIEAMLAAGGKPCGIVGTMGARIAGAAVALDRTTPEAVDLQRILRRMVDAGLGHAVVEVASHALALHRVDGTRFAAAVFTNLTQDHLDFHHSFEAYRDAKRRLFEMVSPAGISIVNADDASGPAMAASSRAPVLTYGMEQPADITASGVRLHLGGSEYTLRTPRGSVPVVTPLHGRFNVSNALAAAAVAQHYGIPLGVISNVLTAFRGVPGRFEAVDEGQGFGVVVDYAHTPDGLDNVIRTAKDFVQGRTIVVFGAGGDRDRTKRPIMGSIVAALADVAVVTSDNPRTEDPAAIIAEIVAGMGGGRAHVEVEPDRRLAIARAVGTARPGDFIIIAGKGHEPYQEIQGTRYPFDDRQVAREALRARSG